MVRELHHIANWVCRDSFRESPSRSVLLRCLRIICSSACLKFALTMREILIVTQCRIPFYYLPFLDRRPGEVTRLLPTVKLWTINIYYNYLWNFFHNGVASNMLLNTLRNLTFPSFKILDIANATNILSAIYALPINESDISISFSNEKMRLQIILGLFL